MGITLRQVFESKHLRGLFGIKPLQQTLPNACGACSIATALRYLGTPVTEQNCVDAMGTATAIGTDPIAMIRYARGKGFYSYGYTKYPLELLIGRAEAGKITLVRWADRVDHWHLVTGTDPVLGQIVLLDPSRGGFLLMSMTEFEQRWAASPRLMLAIDVPQNTRKLRVPEKQVRCRIEPYRKKITIDGRTVAVPT